MKQTTTDEKKEGRNVKGFLYCVAIQIYIKKKD